MQNLRKKIEKRKFTRHLASFVLILLPSAGLYLAAQGNQTNWVWLLLGLIVIGNLLAMV